MTALAFTLVVAVLTVMLAFVNGMYRLTESSSQPGNVIEVAVGRGENFDIRQLESQLFDASFDSWDCLCETRIDENMPCGRDNQV